MPRPLSGALLLLGLAGLLMRTPASVCAADAPSPAASFMAAPTRVEGRGAVLGVVRNGASHEPLPGAVVSLPTLGRTTLSDSAGSYGLYDLPPGEQRLVVHRIGFADHDIQVMIAPGTPLEISVALEPRPIPLAPVEVRAPIALPGSGGLAGAESESSGPPRMAPDRTLTLNEIRQHPLLAEPDVLQAFSGGNVVVPLEAPSGVHVHGGESDQTAYLLDRVPVFSPYHAAGVFSAWNPDALSRLDVRSLDPAQGGIHALSGTIAAETRTPGARRLTQWSLSSGQARLTSEGPLGSAGAGYLVGVRSDFPDLLSPGDDPTFVTGRTGDLLGKVESPLLSGRLRLLGYVNSNRLTAVAGLPDSSGIWRDIGRNAFDWGGHSLGLEWNRTGGAGGVRVQTWQAVADASSRWRATGGPLRLTSLRRDLGLAVGVSRGGPDPAIEVGIRLERMRTEYRVQSDSVAGPRLDLGARTPLATLYADHRWSPGALLEARTGLSLAVVGSAVHPSPRARLTWHASRPLRLIGSYARTHQFAQSLRNGESVTGSIFPSDLYLGSETPEVPVARSDLGLLALDYRRSRTFGLTAQAYARRSTGLVLVAAGSGAPFATGGIAKGSGTAQGVSVEATLTADDFGFVVGYGWQQVRNEAPGTRYQPDHGAGHLFQGGVLFNANLTTSVRLGATGALGRRGTRIANGFEWESCNLLDTGCEFAGSPDTGDEPPGGVRLPGYLRIDLGVRKSWRLNLGGHEASLALFGTVTNLLNRRNVLTFAGTGEGGQAGVKMRPLAPLLVGLEGRF